MKRRDSMRWARWTATQCMLYIPFDMRVLVFGIHPDDVELGCGGTVATCAARGDEVTIVDLTRGESSSNGTAEERADEARVAAQRLGVGERGNLQMPDAGVQSEDPGQQQQVAGCIRRYRPDVVLIPNPDDPHPDHASGGVLIARALYLAGIRGYATPGGEGSWKPSAVLVYSGRREVRPDVVVDITDVLETKRAAIDAHATQFGRAPGAAETPLNAPDFLSAVESRDRVAGLRIGVRFGEAFQLMAPLGLSDLTIFRGGGG